MVSMLRTALYGPERVRGRSEGMREHVFYLDGESTICFLEMLLQAPFFRDVSPIV